MRACSQRAHSAGELAALVELAAASVSEHLKVLRKSGIVTLETRHRFRLYSTDSRALREVEEQLRELSAERL